MELLLELHSATAITDEQSVPTVTPLEQLLVAENAAELLPATLLQRQLKLLSELRIYQAITEPGLSASR
jgi:hypothetical protein